MATSNSLIKKRLQQLKLESGTHSPSIATILTDLPELKIKIDACFLSNPYATDLFMQYLSEITNTKAFRDILEYYPPQNYDVRKKIAHILNTDEASIFVGNGAIEVIQACIHRFSGKRIALPIPTFSSYYEFALNTTEVIFFELKEEENFRLDVIKYSEFIRNKKADTAIIINPNNPVGYYNTKEDIILFLNQNRHLKLIILDESFIHFAFENENLDLINNTELIKEYSNLVIIKSMSKDFGIAGIRAGYGIMEPKRVEELLQTGYLWNISGLTDYFFTVFSRENFQNEYEALRKKYIKETKQYFDSLSSISKIKVYPSKANFALIKIPASVSSFDFCMDMLIDHGIYLRDCNDKIGLSNQGGFIRAASRTLEENKKITEAIHSYFQ